MDDLWLHYEWKDCRRNSKIFISLLRETKVEILKICYIGLVTNNAPFAMPFVFLSYEDCQYGARGFHDCLQCEQTYSRYLRKALKSVLDVQGLCFEATQDFLQPFGKWRLIVLKFNERIFHFIYDLGSWSISHTCSRTATQCYRLWYVVCYFYSRPSSGWCKCC